MSLVLKDVAHKLIQPVSFQVSKGEMLVLAGPSGAGKTTLLRLIAGLETITQGSIILEGKEIGNLPPHRRKVAMVFQNHTLYPQLTIRQNLAFPLQKTKYHRKEIEDKIDMAVSILGIENLIERSPDTLSGGERQKVALGTVLVQEPKVLLLDEPFTHLDIPNQYILREEIKRLQSCLSIPIIYVTHNHSEALSMGDRIAVIIGGRLLQIDSPEVIYTNPISLSVANFLGTPPVNIIHGELKDGHLFLQEIPPLFYPIKHPSGNVIIAIRPEDIHIKNDSGFSAKVSRIEYMGSEKILHLYRGSLKLRCRVFENTDIRASDTINVCLDLEKACCFSGLDVS